MALHQRETTSIRQHLNTPANVTYIVDQLKAGAGKTIPDKQHNFTEIKWWLKSMLVISTDDAGIRETADIIQEFGPPKPALVIETALPPVLDVAKEKKKITDDCGHSTTI